MRAGLIQGGANGALSIRTFGSGPEIVALHGFTLTGAQFTEMASLLRRTVLAPDLPGHGATTVDASFDATRRALATWMEAFAPLPLIGYSMGGRIALDLAISHPTLVSDLVVISASPGITDTAAREARREEDRARADRIEAMGIEAFLDEWSAHPVAGTTRIATARGSADRAVRSENTAAGIAAALCGLGLGTQEPLTDRLGELDIPVLFVAGSLDPVYARIADEVAAATGGTSVVVAGAGHNVLLERPHALAGVINAFLGDYQV